jgi:6-phosphogluconolactonase
MSRADAVAETQQLTRTYARRQVGWFKRYREAVQLDADDRVAVPVTGSPKPPPERVSLTFAALNRTRATWFLVTGEEKADAVHRALADAGDVHQTPARGISPTPISGAGETIWFLDLAAAGQL